MTPCHRNDLAGSRNDVPEDLRLAVRGLKSVKVTVITSELHNPVNGSISQIPSETLKEMVDKLANKVDTVLQQEVLVSQFPHPL